MIDFSRQGTVEQGFQRRLMNEDRKSRRQFSLRQFFLSITFFALALAAFVTLRKLVYHPMYVEPLALRTRLILVMSSFAGIFTGLTFGVFVPRPVIGPVVGAVFGLGIGAGVLYMIAIGSMSR